MSGLRKRFDPALYAANDELAKTKLFDLIKDVKGIKAEGNPKKRDVDVIVRDPNTDEILFYIELEIKRVWNGPFKYNNVQFPQRKEKYAKLDKPTLFVMFNHDQSEHLVVKSDDFLASPCVEVPNKYMYKGEYFYQIPVDKVAFNGVQSVIKELLNGSKKR